MNHMKKTVRDVDISGKRVLIRCDFNVPQSKETNEITDDARIVATLPTLEYLLDNGAMVIACSHLGRPDGLYAPKLSLKPVAERLSQLLNRPVTLAEADGDALPFVLIDDNVKKLASELKPGEIMLLENTRFVPEEEANDPGFAKELASLADVFVSDAFGAVHRAHASTAGVAAYLPAVSGFLLDKELQVLGDALSDPKRPFTAILGGAKISDKLGVIENLIDKVDRLLIGGGMAYTFLKASGHSIGNSLCEDNMTDRARMMMEKAVEKGVDLILPTDHYAVESIGAEPQLIDSIDIPDKLIAVDVGPATCAKFADTIKTAATIFWNGPVGIFENPLYAAGTRSIADAMAECSGTTIVGGGDSAAAVELFGLTERMSHVSTGGGSSLEFIEGKQLPGVVCLDDAE